MNRYRWNSLIDKSENLFFFLRDLMISFLQNLITARACLEERTNSSYGPLTWPTTFAGEAEFSLETCPEGTQKCKFSKNM